jgi:hypothetical protein
MAGAAEAGLTEMGVAHMSQLCVMLSNDPPEAIDYPWVQVTDTIERFTGRKPETLRDFLADKREYLRSRP